MRILLVEDNLDLAGAIATGLRQEGMAVDVVHDGGDALDRASYTRYDVVVLDRDLPVVHGDDVCRRLAEREYTGRILMLTAAATIEDRVDGLGIGADDYLPKPFAFAELVARVRALGRRPPTATAPVLVAGELRLDTTQRTASRGGRRLPLSPKELGVLERLLLARGRPVSAEELLEQVWDGETDPFTNTVKVTINRLRGKLGDPPVIETVPQAGYRVTGFDD